MFTPTPGYFSPVVPPVVSSGKRISLSLSDLNSTLDKEGMPIGVEKATLDMGDGAGTAETGGTYSKTQFSGTKGIAPAFETSFSRSRENSVSHVGSRASFSPRGSSASRQGEVDSLNYKRELTKLLAKSRGTAYEASLKKFVEAKYREIKKDEEERQYMQRVANSESLGDLSRASKLDRAPEAARNASFTLMGNTFSLHDDRQNRLEQMAKPRENRMYQGPQSSSPPRISTNHVGRQRPGPPLQYLSPATRPERMGFRSPSSLMGSTLNVHRSPDASPFRPHSAANPLNSSGATAGRLRSSSPAGRGTTGANSVHGEGAGFIPSSSVTTQDFNHWLKKNREWEEKKKLKKRQILEEQQQVAMQRSRSPSRCTSPSRSAMLADVANQREFSRIVGSSLRSGIGVAGGYSPRDWGSQSGCGVGSYDAAGVHSVGDGSSRGHDGRSRSRSGHDRGQLLGGRASYSEQHDAMSSQDSTGGVREHAPQQMLGLGAPIGGADIAAVGQGEGGEVDGDVHSVASGYYSVGGMIPHGGNSTFETLGAHHGGAYSTQSLAPDDVYERLALRGRFYADRKLQRQYQQQRPSPRMFSHSPVISDRSRKLAEIKRQKDLAKCDGDADSATNGTLGSRPRSASASLAESRGGRHRELSHHMIPTSCSSSNNSVGTPRSARSATSVKRVDSSGLSKLRQRLAEREAEKLLGSSDDHLSTSKRSGKGSESGNRNRGDSRGEIERKSRGDSSSRRSERTGASAAAGTASTRGEDDGGDDSGSVHSQQSLSSRGSYGSQQSRGSEGSGTIAVDDREALREQTKEALKRSRSLSQQRRAKELQDFNKKHYGTSKVPKDVKPFQPTMIASESQRIMARVKSSFVERNTRSIENRLVRRELSRRSCSPGPGHYSKAPAAADKLVVPSRSPSARSPSPGAKGYSFGKAPSGRFWDDMYYNYYHSRGAPDNSEAFNKRDLL